MFKTIFDFELGQGQSCMSGQVGEPRWTKVQYTLKVAAYGNNYINVKNKEQNPKHNGCLFPKLQ